MKNRVFISRSLPEDHLFRTKSSDIEWVDRSMIHIEPITFEPDVFKACNWIFCTSSNAAQIYFEHASLFPGQRVAAVGPGTANSLKAMDIPVHFTGTHDTERTAVEFAELVGSDQIGFPVSDGSRRTIQKALASRQIKEQVVYQTQEAPRQVSACDIYFFTSPSNVRAFFKLNNIPSDAVVIAIGEPTASELKLHGVESLKPANYEQEAQWDAIFSALSS